MDAAINLQIPDWLVETAGSGDLSLSSDEERMSFVIGLARDNIRRGTGGPFAAAVFECGGSRPVACGVNMVVSANCAVAHAEIVAIMLACAGLGVYDLSQGPAPGGYELFSSTDPCAMCLGAVPWSGVKRLVCGADGADAEAAGFDEGAKPIDWEAQLIRRGIRVCRHVCRTEAAAVLDEYAADGGIIYNGRQSAASAE